MLTEQEAGNGVQVIIETHSDHVINGIRMAAAVDRTIDPAATMILFSSDRNMSFESIEVTSQGSLSRWPAGFFDQMDIDLGGLARARQPR